MARARSEVRKGKKMDRRAYEEKAKAQIKQRTRVTRALQRAPSGYLTPEAERLVPGNGIMSYTYTDLLRQQQQSGQEPDPAGADAGADADADASAEAAAAGTPEDGFLGFDAEFEETPLLSQFTKFEDNLAKEHEQRAREQVMQLPDHPAPWNHSKKGDSMPEKLCREIKNYISYMSPTDREISDRNDLVARIQQAAKTLLRGAECQLFGSSAVDMYLPQADVDMVLVNNGQFDRERNILYQLKAYFLRRGWTTEAQVIGRARVPIVKFTDSRTRLHVDIAIGKAGGVETIKIVKDWMKRQPALRPLVLVLKQFLKRRKLAEVFHGGLGGFATICLVMSYLENHEKLRAGEIKAMENLGILLYELLEFYGKTFDSQRYALRMTGKMPRVLKSTSSVLQLQKDAQISVEDPWDYTNNITRSSYNWQEIQRAFSHGADMLKRMMHDYSQEEDASKRSFLGPLLKNEWTKDRHSMEVMKEKVSSLFALANSAQNSPRVSKKERKEKAKRQQEKNKKAKRKSLNEELSSPKRRNRDGDGNSSVIDLTSDLPPRNAALRQVFEPASSSGSSDLEVTMVRDLNPTKCTPDSSEDEVSRTKVAGPGATERKRAFWAKKAGLEAPEPAS